MYFVVISHAVSIVSWLKNGCSMATHSPYPASPVPVEHLDEQNAPSAHAPEARLERRLERQRDLSELYPFELHYFTFCAGRSPPPIPRVNPVT